MQINFSQVFRKITICKTNTLFHKILQDGPIEGSYKYYHLKDISYLNSFFQYLKSSVRAHHNRIDRVGNRPSSISYYLLLK